jgi:nucleoside-diphosphate-sugar epimerase
MDRARQLLESWGPGATIELMEGDICSLDLGLTGKQYKGLRQRITDVYHLAALWHTSASAKRLRQVNVQGTRNVVLCARDLDQLRRFNHFSTAYVCGDREGVILEEELEEGQSFGNAYEATQYEAEREVRRASHELPISIYRPSLIVGHSQTGQIDRMSGPYALIKPMIALPVDVPLPLPGAGRAPLNLVPVDYVVEAMYTISLDERGLGRTFHLVDPNPLGGRRVLELIALAAGKPLPRGSVPEFLTRIITRVPMLERASGAGLQVLSDFNRWSLFNNLNTMELTRQGPWCPSLPTYVEPMVRHLTQDEPEVVEVSDAG